MSLEIFHRTGRAALATGGSKGLGKAMAAIFAEAGAEVMISSRHEVEEDRAVFAVDLKRVGPGRGDN